MANKIKVKRKHTHTQHDRQIWKYAQICNSQRTLAIVSVYVCLCLCLCIVWICCRNPLRKHFQKKRQNSANEIQQTSSTGSEHISWCSNPKNNNCSMYMCELFVSYRVEYKHRIFKINNTQRDSPDAIFQLPCLMALVSAVEASSRVLIDFHILFASEKQQFLFENKL